MWRTLRLVTAIMLTVTLLVAQLLPHLVDALAVPGPQPNSTIVTLGDVYLGVSRMPVHPNAHNELLLWAVGEHEREMHVLHLYGK